MLPMHGHHAIVQQLQKLHLHVEVPIWILWRLHSIDNANFSACLHADRQRSMSISERSSL